MAPLPTTHHLPRHKTIVRGTQEGNDAAAGHRPLLSRPRAGGLPGIRALLQRRRGIRKSFEGSSLETIKHMVAAGMGVTLVPRLSVPKDAFATKPKRRSDDQAFVKYIPFEGDPPNRRVVLAWPPQLHALRGHRELRNSIYACELPGVKRLS